MFPTLKQRFYKGMKMSFRTFLKREVKEEMERLKPQGAFPARVPVGRGKDMTAER